MFSCLLIALAFSAPGSINTSSPMTSAAPFNKAFPGDGCFVGELVGMSNANVDPQLSPLLLTSSITADFLHPCFWFHRCLQGYRRLDKMWCVHSGFLSSVCLVISKWGCFFSSCMSNEVYSPYRRAACSIICLIHVAISTIKTILLTLHSRGELKREGVDMPLPLLSACD